MILQNSESKKRITLALGGGGARGLAHLGVIEVLVDAGYEIERIVGVSIGSLTGAAFAFDPDIYRVQERTMSYLQTPEFQVQQEYLLGENGNGENEATGGLFGWYTHLKNYMRSKHRFIRVVNHPSLLSGDILESVVEHLVPDADIAAAKIPLSIVAVDLLSGHRIVLEGGSARKATQGSSSMPGIFPPVEFRDMLLSDLGVLDSLPTVVARSYDPTCLVAVDVASEIQQADRFDSAMDVLLRMDEVSENLFRKHFRNIADIVIKPEVHETDWFDFRDRVSLLEAGRKAAERALPVLSQLHENEMPEPVSNSRWSFPRLWMQG